MAAAGRGATSDHRRGDAVEAAAPLSQLIATWEPRGGGQLDLKTFEDFAQSKSIATAAGNREAELQAAKPHPVMGCGGESWKSARRAFY